MLMRFDPFRELDRVTQQLTGAPRSGGMPMDGYRRGDQVLLHFDLPGVDPSTIDLTVEKNVLTVTAERRWEPTEDVEILVSERPQGQFSRQLFLGDGLDPDSISADYEAGVLTVTVSVADQAKPRKVEVRSGDHRATAISADSTAA